MLVSATAQEAAAAAYSGYQVALVKASSPVPANAQMISTPDSEGKVWFGHDPSGWAANDRSGAFVASSVGSEPTGTFPLPGTDIGDPRSKWAGYVLCKDGWYMPASPVEPMSQANFVAKFYPTIPHNVDGTTEKANPYSQQFLGYDYFKRAGGGLGTSLTTYSPPGLPDQGSMRNWKEFIGDAIRAFTDLSALPPQPAPSANALASEDWSNYFSYLELLGQRGIQVALLDALARAVETAIAQGKQFAIDRTMWKKYLRSGIDFATPLLKTAPAKPAVVTSGNLAQLGLAQGTDPERSNIANAANYVGRWAEYSRELDLADSIGAVVDRIMK